MKTSALLLVAMASAACGNNSQSVTAPSATTLTSASGETFSGSLLVQGSSFYSFTVTTAGTVSVTLASLVDNTTGPASTAVVRVGVGVPVGTGCSISQSVDTAAGLTTQLTAPVNVDTYCVQISDIGALTAPVQFSIRIVQGVSASSSTATPATTTFATFLAVGGWSAQTLAVPQSGTVVLTLTAVSPSAVVGMGIGIPSTTGASCSLSRSVQGAPEAMPQLTLSVDPGTYCVEVFDGGTVAAPGVSFSVTINYP
jgi:hypothetical protein